MSAAAHDALELTLADFLERVARSERAPGGGSGAAAALAIAAGVVVGAARSARGRWELAAGAAGQAEALRRRVAPLVQADADAYAEASLALRSVGGEAGGSPARDFALGQKLERAAAIPLELALAAGDVALLAADVAEHGDPDARADAVAACLLAEGAARAAAHLVDINLTMTPDDERRELIVELEPDLAAARERALGAA